MTGFDDVLYIECGRKKGVQDGSKFFDLRIVAVIITN